MVMPLTSGPSMAAARVTFVPFDNRVEVAVRTPLNEVRLRLSLVVLSARIPVRLAGGVKMPSMVTIRRLERMVAFETVMFELHQRISA